MMLDPKGDMPEMWGRDEGGGETYWAMWEHIQDELTEKAIDAIVESDDVEQAFLSMEHDLAPVGFDYGDWTLEEWINFLECVKAWGI
jgi:hypothetical protein